MKHIDQLMSVLMQLCHRLVNRFVTCVKVEEFFCQVKILTQCQRRKGVAGVFFLPSQHVRQDVQSLQLDRHVILFPHGTDQLGCDLLTNTGCQVQTWRPAT